MNEWPCKCSACIQYSILEKQRKLSTDELFKWMYDHQQLTDPTNYGNKILNELKEIKELIVKALNK